MGANYAQFKIDFKKEEHSSFLNNLFLDFQDYKIPKILDKRNPLEELFDEKNYTKIKHALAFAWCVKGEGLTIEKFHLDKKTFELEIYGGSDMLMMEELIFNVSYHLGVEKYLELTYTTRANGLCLKWLENNKAFWYEDEQTENFSEFDENNSIDYCFKRLDELMKDTKLKISEVKIEQPNETEFLGNLNIYPDFLERIELGNKQWELEQEKNRQRLLQNKSRSAQISKKNKNIGMGIRALLGNRGKESK